MKSAFIGYIRAWYDVNTFLFIHFFILYILLTVGVIPLKVLSTLIKLEPPYTYINIDI